MGEKMRILPPLSPTARGAAVSDRFHLNRDLARRLRLRTQIAILDKASPAIKAGRITCPQHLVGDVECQRWLTALSQRDREMLSNLGFRFRAIERGKIPN